LLKKAWSIADEEKNHPSGAKAQPILMGLMYGLKPVPFKNNAPSGLFQQAVKTCPFKAATYSEVP
jgi:hypothetical protein